MVWTGVTDSIFHDDNQYAMFTFQNSIVSNSEQLEVWFYAIKMYHKAKYRVKIKNHATKTFNK